MKKKVFALMMLGSVMTAQAQINSNYHWYDGAITYTATHLEHNNVLMTAMDEGEEHEFILRYDREVNPNHQIYTTMNGPHDYVNEYGVGKTVRHQRADGWDVICFYDSENRLKSVMTGEMDWNAEKLNKRLWLNQMVGEYASEEEDDCEKCLSWTMESLSVSSIVYPYEIITFNGRVTGFITVKPVDGALNELEGTWEVVPTLKGFRLYSVNTGTGSMPWEWERDGRMYEFAESDPDVGRFFYASNMLLNDLWFRHFDLKTLRIMRNAILARHGYRFQSKDLQDYFSNEKWYKPAASNKNVKLSFIEQLNIELIKSVEAEKATEQRNQSQNAGQRQEIHFNYELIKADDDDFGSIVVKGYKADGEKPFFECRHELVAHVSDLSATDVQWVNDSQDINFDGNPDLQIFLWYFTRGQVAESWAAYVQTPRHTFEEVRQWADLCNPQIHPDNKTVTENYRSDINERTFKTYKWNGANKLELVNTHQEKLFDE